MHAVAFQLFIAAATLFCGGVLIGFRFRNDDAPIAGLCISILGAALLTFTILKSQ